jgi:hypothetical protein
VQFPLQNAVPQPTDLLRGFLGEYARRILEVELDHSYAIQLVDNAEPGGIIPPMILTLDAKRRLTLPASLVPAQPGDHFQAEFDPDEDAVVFRRIARNADWLNVLKACPVKMDDLPPRRREFVKRLKL